MGEDSGKFRKRISFAMVSNTILRDDRMSLKAKGLYALIQSYLTLDGFTLYKGFLQSKCKEGDKAFDSAWKELKASGYLVQHRMHDGNKCFYYEYELIDDPLKKDCGYVYIMKSMNKYKIGRANVRATRLGEYTKLPEEPSYLLFRFVEHNKYVENELHKMFSDKRLRDGKCEWFDLCEDDINVAREFVKQYETEIPYGETCRFDIVEV